MTQAQVQQLLRRPLAVDETGLSLGLLSELTLKTIYNAGEIGASDISRAMRLPFLGVVQRVLELLDREELVGVTGARGFGEQAYRYTVSRKGMDRLHEVLERSQYVGPAPVPLECYNAMIRAQALGNVSLDEAAVAQGFQDLVVGQDMLDRIGPALNSGRSVFLYGPSGNGKTTIANRMARLLARDPIYIPYAVAIDSYIIKVYDSFNHRQAAAGRADPLGLDAGPAFQDERWVQIERPAVVVGGELTLASLDLIWDPVAKYYEAPFQMKANGGMFLIDDFGRQHMNPRDLLNRWIIPLETRGDFLTLHTGKKIEVPFEEVVAFSTNLDPRDLMDEAFLRRIRHKILVGNPTEEQFRTVFRLVCRERGVEYVEEGFAHLVNRWYHEAGREFKNSHPRDIIDQLLDNARYRHLRPVAGREMLDQACSAYFADL